MKRLYLVLLLGIFFIPANVFACAIASFEQEGTSVEPSGLSQALIVWNEGKETLILDPQLKGDAQDFGLAFAFPSKPEVTEADRAIFNELSEYTKPKVVAREQTGSGQFFGAAAVAPESAAPDVTVVEEKEVGDFTVVVLQAIKTSALGEWLKKNGYQYNSNDENNFDYYVKKGGQYFVALKMTAPETLENVPQYARGNYQFKPISFAFQTTTPLFPSRLAKDEDPVQEFRIYALSKTALMVPGAATPFAKSIDSAEMRYNVPSLSPYLDDVKQWLVKLDMLIDPSAIEHDLQLLEWKNPQEFHMTTQENPRVLLADAIQQGSGIFLASADEPKYDRAEFRGSISDFDKDFYKLMLPVPCCAIQPWYERDEIIGWIWLFVILIIHFYIGAALFTLARRFGVRHRWRAWIPLTNLHLIIRLAERQRWWFWVMVSVLLAAWIIIPSGFIISTVVAGLLIPDQLPQQEFMSLGYYGLIFLVFGLLVPVTLFIVECVFLIRIFSSLAVRCGRPSWWGPLMILVPPVGLVLLGVLAWSKNKTNA